jgi:hypothetical protein
VLSRLPEPAEAQRVILERQATSDVEREEAELVEEFFRDRLQELDYCPDTERVFIPSTVARDWFNAATNERESTISASRRLVQQLEEGKLHSLAKSRSRTHGRGVVWIGKEANPDEPMLTDVQSRIATKGRLR